MFDHVAEVTGHEPDADDDRAHSDAAEQHFLRQRGAVAQHEDQQPGHDHARDREAGRVQRISAAGQQCRQVLAGREVEPDRLDRTHADHCQHAPQRDVGDEAEHDDDDQALEAAGAGAHQRLRPAAAGEHHAQAEEQAAENVGERREALRRVEARGRIDHAERGQQRRSRHRHRDRQRPLPHPRPVAVADDVGDAAHRAETGAVDERAEIAPRMSAATTTCVEREAMSTSGTTG